MRQASKLAGMTALLLGSLATAAMAAPAEIAAAAALRSGPGTGYRVAASLPAHAIVDIGNCAGNWCPARWRGVAGYISLAALAVAAPPVVDPDADQWDTDNARDNWIRVRRNGQWIWVPHDDRRARDERDRNRNRDRNAGNDRRQNAAALRGDGGATIWRPTGGMDGNRSADSRGSMSGGGRGDGGGGRGGDGGGRGGDGGGGDGGGGRGR
jgi:hypothetical protein